MMNCNGPGSKYLEKGLENKGVRIQTHIFNSTKQVFTNK